VTKRDWSVWLFGTTANK